MYCAPLRVTIVPHPFAFFSVAGSADATPVCDVSADLGALLTSAAKMMLATYTRVLGRACSLRQP